MPIPANALPLWEHLQREVVRLTSFWKTFEQLFLHGPGRAQMLVEAGDAFFPLVMETFLEHIHLTISKLADPAGTGERTNATLKRLLEYVEAMPDAPADMKTALRQFLASMKEHACHIIDRRNRLHAHFDLSTAVPSDPVAPARPEIPSATREEVQASLDQLFAFMNTIESYYTGFETEYRLTPITFNANKLLCTIKQGLRYNELLGQHVIPYEDLAHGEFCEA